ncbi:LacI family DNA-binding transcriptional regulator [Achromobacter arsenitoxydans]|uniref:LacI family transcription regulator n=1 Tax=Achromobacter arsenitoxydans SY8 TaxID=477184 RepID=H0F6W5_9BURK|nr:LacI family DNA-binding transcriptional regulator [Achromobacter arsenitoxydans]EHK66023.1 LacI family transcription regulator [Achromobacter arsenitoxydans SY8]
MPPIKQKSITLHDVAREAGVSLITASRALSNPDRVSDKTVARVQAVADAIGYIPNLLAGGLKSRRSKTVAALVPIISVQQFLPTIEALTEQLDRAGYQLLLGQTGYDRAREADLLNSMVGRQVDGIVMAGLLSDTPARTRIRAAGIPLVETWDITDEPFDMLVGFSHLEVGRAVADYFLAKGWTRFGVATGDDQRALIRRQGFVDRIGHDVPTAVVPAPSNVGSGRQAGAELLTKDPSIRAIFCSSDTLAEGVLTEARVRGLRVPEDLAVCGFGGTPFSGHLAPTLTTVHVDGSRIGVEAGRILLARCRGETPDEPFVDVGFRIIERESTAGR